MTVREKEDQALVRLDSKRRDTLDTLNRCHPGTEAHETLVKRAIRFERAMGRIVTKGDKKS